MKKYIGTKTVQAVPCSLEEATERLGRSITPATGETEGYLVEYEDGYQSWSPKSTFDKAYQLAETFLDRLYIERSELADKMEKLSDFMQTDVFKGLASNKQADLKEQYAAMHNYIRIVNRRITDEVGETPSGSTHLPFGAVIEGLKQGRCYRRVGWNDKGMFICKQIPARLEGMAIEKLQNLPQTAKDIILACEGVPAIAYTNQMLIINPDGRADSWVPSVSDVFAEDWKIVQHYEIFEF